MDRIRQPRGFRLASFVNAAPYGRPRRSLLRGGLSHESLRIPGNRLAGSAAIAVALAAMMGIASAQDHTHHNKSMGPFLALAAPALDPAERRGAALWEGLGPLHYSITTASPQAAAIFRPGAAADLCLQPCRGAARLPPSPAARSRLRALLLGRGLGSRSQHQRPHDRGRGIRRRSRPWPRRRRRRAAPAPRSRR